MASKVRVTRLQLTNFKGFPRFSLTLGSMNMLVGPNNAGKSTVIGAFRALSIAIRTGSSRNATQHRLNDEIYWGHRIGSEAIPISLENAQHNYNDDNAVAKFYLSNGGTLTLLFAAEVGCLLTAEYADRPVKAAAAFRQRFPLTIGVVPVLGPLEHEEQQVEERTVQRNLQTHRASRNFRNYWYYNSQDFGEFQTIVSQTWNGIEIQRPELTYEGDGPSVLHMWCTEDRIARELYWMGFGFHIWLQIMTHVMRNRGASILIVDEPETYMHPALQRDLLATLREADADCLIATHSSEMVAEAERSEVVLVDKRKQSGQRLTEDIDTKALGALGSSFNFALADVLRQRTAMFVEGDSDLRMLKQLGRRLEPSVLVGSRVPPRMSLGGHQPEKAADMARAMKSLIGEGVRLAVVLDRDYRSDDEVEALERRLASEFQVAHVLRRKEIENYFLVPDVLEREIGRRMGGEDSDGREAARVIVEAVAEDMRDHTLSHCLSRYVAYGEKKRDGKDRSTLTKEGIDRFREVWRTLEGRLTLVPGKTYLRNANSVLEGKGVRKLTTAELARTMRVGDVPPEMAAFLRQVDGLTG